MQPTCTRISNKIACTGPPSQQLPGDGRHEQGGQDDQREPARHAHHGQWLVSAWWFEMRAKPGNVEHRVALGCCAYGMSAWDAVPRQCGSCTVPPHCHCRSVTLMKMADDDMAMKDGTGSMTMLTDMKVADNTNKQVGHRGCCHWPVLSSLGLLHRVDCCTSRATLHSGLARCHPAA